MTDKPDEDALEPNRVRISGEAEADIVAVSLDVGPNEITVDTRTSPISGEQVTLPYDRLESVRVEREATYTVVFETNRREYALTNISADRGAAWGLVDYAREQGGLRTTTQSNGSTAESQTSSDGPTESNEMERGDESQMDEETEPELDEWSWGETPDPD